MQSVEVTATIVPTGSGLLPQLVPPKLSLITMCVQGLPDASLPRQENGLCQVHRSRLKSSGKVFDATKGNRAFNSVEVGEGEASFWSEVRAGSEHVGVGLTRSIVDCRLRSRCPTTAAELEWPSIAASNDATGLNFGPATLGSLGHQGLGQGWRACRIGDKRRLIIPGRHHLFFFIFSVCAFFVSGLLVFMADYIICVEGFFFFFSSEA